MNYDLAFNAVNRLQYNRLKNWLVAVIEPTKLPIETLNLLNLML